MAEFTEDPPFVPVGPAVDQDDLTKVTVYIVPSAIEAMNVAAERCGDSRTDTINRALLWYEASTRRSYRWTLRYWLTALGWLAPVFIADLLWSPRGWLVLAVSAAWGLMGVVVALRLNWRPR